MSKVRKIRSKKTKTILKSFAEDEVNELKNKND